MRSLVAEHFLVGAAEVVVIFTSGYFCRGGGGERAHALIHSGKWKDHDLFRKKFLKYPDPPSHPPPPQ